MSLCFVVVAKRLSFCFPDHINELNYFSSILKLRTKHLEDLVEHIIFNALNNIYAILLCYFIVVFEIVDFFCINFGDFLKTV